LSVATFVTLLVSLALSALTPTKGHWKEESANISRTKSAAAKFTVLKASAFNANGALGGLKFKHLSDFPLNVKKISQVASVLIRVASAKSAGLALGFKTAGALGY
jgi:hypothetical protein